MNAAEVLCKNDTVYADLSGLTPGEVAAEFEGCVPQRLKGMIAQLVDAGRQLLVGSDWPLVRTGPYVDSLENLKRPEERKGRIAWKASSRLFSIEMLATRQAV